MNIECICLASTCGCNLNCEYCLISQSAKSGYNQELHAKTEQALIDGTFYNNVKKVLKEMSINPENITKFDLWGQEPTLTIQHITDNFEKWNTLFPNIKGIFFSTNGMAFTDRILNFIKKVDNVAKRHISIGIQFSYDGDLSTDTIRNANSEIIYNNLIYLITELNKTKLFNTDVDVLAHGVLSYKLINSFNDENTIRDYFVSLNKKIQTLDNLNINQNVKVRPYSYFSSEVPINASSDDGKKFKYFTNVCSQLKYNTSNIRGIDSSTEGLLWMIYNIRERILQKMECKNLDEVIKKILLADKNELQEINHKLSSFATCGEYIGSLKVMYDGTIVNCQSLIFDTDVENIKETNEKEYWCKKFMAEHDFYYNPLTDPIDSQERIKYIFNTLFEESFLYVFNQVVSLMKNLSETHQISKIYEDYEYLLKGALVLTPMHACFYNSIITSGSLFNRESGYIRRYCNGLLDQVLVEDTIL